jgi:hypothetical protein
LLEELTRGDLPKSKFPAILGVKRETVFMYVKQLCDAGLIEETHVVEGKRIVEMLRLLFSGVSVFFNNITEGNDDGKSKEGRSGKEEKTIQQEPQA